MPDTLTEPHSEILTVRPPDPAPKTLFVAEDSRYSIRALKRKLRHWPVPHQMVIARDGQEAIEMLYPVDPDEGAPMPDILLLDLNMPRVSGLEVLSFLRSRPRYAGVPVVILTTSDSHYDMDHAAALDVDAYLIKDASDTDICGVLNALLNPADAAA